MTNPAHSEAAPRHTKPLIQKAAKAFMALAFSIDAVRETIAPANEQIKKEGRADSQKRKLKPGLTS
ncbi:hypothetical protein [Pusillimonas sp. ANT_WB101]|uniref:hypothetical protein n=1 Tax=Pusillimonas sp. ANT_WB101 TaxID=2597356 RepID=UPI0011ED3DA9|nr:hypothetical protein [Pusillimonas sp. ANT_WB101]KAA0891148.1 hypothetical protein FQ179_16070 [Pusillimonas sp. ANT_WB101]